jgi:hypothetical protein
MNKPLTRDILSVADLAQRDMFLESLKRFNVKERNFLMRYALSGSLSDQFLSDLLNHLKGVPISGLDGAQAVYWGMDFHFEWINAALLLAKSELKLSESGWSFPPRRGVHRGRIEDVDLLVVLQKANGTLVMVLIEAKGVTSFNSKQSGSKLKRLDELNASKEGSTAWLQSIMLLMSPTEVPPSHGVLKSALAEFSSRGFWPVDILDNAAAFPHVWMPLKDFFLDMGNSRLALRIGTCNEDGKPAEDIDARNANPYEYWQVQPRKISTKAVSLPA